MGVTRLATGSLRESCRFFHESLHATMAQLHEPSSVSQGSRHLTSNPVWMRKGTAAFVEADALQQQPQLFAAPASFLYPHGIALVDESGAYSSDRVTDDTIAASIVLFNLALVHHIKSVTESSSRWLVKAQSFYRRTYDMLVNLGFDLGSNANPMIDLLSMALLNNAAHVDYELCQRQSSVKRIQQLIHVASQVNAADYTEPSVVLFMENVRNDFLLNAVILQDQYLQQAPAA